MWMIALRAVNALIRKYPLVDDEGYENHDGDRTDDKATDILHEEVILSWA
jgi:hypothetical protein